VRPATKPVADFDIAEDTKEAGELFSFINRSIGANTTYTWAIRGAHTELVNTTNATAVYDAPGTYTVVLSATNPSGTSLKSKKVTVKAAAPTPGFSVSPSAILLGEQTYLVDNSRGKADNWFWILDNGKRVLGVNGQNSSYTPKHPGVYDISLTTSNDVGSKSLTQKRRLYVSNADAKNYELTINNGKMTVEKAELTVRAENKSRLYGDANPEFTLSYAGLKNDETVPEWEQEPSIVTTATMKSDVGTYPISVESAVAVNYNITPVEGTLTVKKAPLEMTPNDATRMYGEENPTFTLSYVGLKNSENSPEWVTEPVIETSANASPSILLVGALSIFTRIVAVPLKPFLTSILNTTPSMSFGTVYLTVPIT